MSPDELSTERYVEGIIRTDVTATSGGQDTVAAVLRLIALIDSLGIHDDVRFWLHGELVTAVWEESPCATPALVLQMLASGDEKLEDFAVSGFFRSRDALIEDQTLRGALLKVWDDRETQDHVRDSIVRAYWLSEMQYFGEIDTRAHALAATHGELAHSVAKMIALATHEDEASLRKLLTSPERAVREEAAMLLAEDQVADDVIPLVAAVAKDGDESPLVRGEAIRSLTGRSERPAYRAALLELLNRRYWFYGAAGSHFPIHSLGLVIDGLRDDRATLLALRPAVATLPDGEREYVQWELENALGNHTEVFGGPVKPVEDH
jgi:hypothetical protein